MGRDKVTIKLQDGSIVWLNRALVVKMRKAPDGRYFVYMINGECYEIDNKQARLVEDVLES